MLGVFRVGQQLHAPCGREWPQQGNGIVESVDIGITHELVAVARQRTKDEWACTTKEHANYIS